MNHKAPHVREVICVPIVNCKGHVQLRIWVKRWCKWRFLR